MSRTIQQTIDYCKERKAFGQPIINYQVIHYTLAELQTEAEALRSLVYRAAGMFVFSSLKVPYFKTSIYVICIYIYAYLYSQ